MNVGMMHLRIICVYMAVDPLPCGDILRAAFVGMAETCDDISNAAGFRGNMVPCS